MPEAHIQYGRHLLFRGRTREALQSSRRQGVRTLHRNLILSLGRLYLSTCCGQLDSASAINEQALQSGR